MLSARSRFLYNAGDGRSSSRRVLFIVDMLTCCCSKCANRIFHSCKENFSLPSAVEMNSAVCLFVLFGRPLEGWVVKYLVSEN